MWLCVLILTSAALGWLSSGRVCLHTLVYQFETNTFGQCVQTTWNMYVVSTYEYSGNNLLLLLCLWLGSCLGLWGLNKRGMWIFFSPYKWLSWKSCVFCGNQHSKVLTANKMKFFCHLKCFSVNQNMHNFLVLAEWQAQNINTDELVSDISYNLDNLTCE